MKKNLRILFATAAVLGLSASVGLAQQSQEKPPKAAKAVKNKPSASGVVVVIDPKTHEIVPASPEEIGALDKRTPATKRANLQNDGATAARSGTGEIRHHTGAMGMKLDESYMTSMVVSRDANGKLSYECLEGSKDGKAKAISTGKTGMKAKEAGAPDVK